MAILITISIFLLSAQVIGSAQMLSHHHIIGILGESILLPCSLNSSAPVVPARLKFYWTVNETILAHVFYDGKENNDPQDSFYKNRTEIFTDLLSSRNFSLLLKDLRVKDDLTTFFVFYRQEDENSNELIQKKKMCSTILRVAKSFQKPVVTVNYEDRKAECTSRGGYPEPRLTWTNQNGLLDHEDPQITQDSGSGTVNIYSTVNITENQMVTCTIFNPTLKETLNTTKSTSEVQEGFTPSIIGVTVPIITVLILICFGVFYFVYKKGCGARGGATGASSGATGASSGATGPTDFPQLPEVVLLVPELVLLVPELVLQEQEVVPQEPEVMLQEPEVEILVPEVLLQETEVMPQETAVVLQEVMKSRAF
ncbi:butyrophilin-like protein 10 [Salmo trutta]|uniref:butyrophilin-like protein 10 n=1 Tax=Salmo trutta TaxID=8032 RepID=UPI001131C6C7|nr:butyrophilin-like protein 10 [Salmo trutta]